MINKTPSLDLVEFIETQILPRYAAFDRAHNMEHVTRVIRSSLELSRITGADINMVYTMWPMPVSRSGSRPSRSRS